MGDERKWTRIVRLANADVADDGALAVALRNVTLAFGVVPHLRGVPALGHSGLAREARAILPSLRVLLRRISGVATKREQTVARNVLAEHRRHVAITVSQVLEELPPRSTSSRRRGAGTFGDFLAAVGFDGKSSGELRLEGTKRTKETKWRMKRGQVPVYRDALDPVCDLIQEKARFEPVRVCQACGKFFVREGRRLHCSGACKAKRWRPKFQMSAAERRDYQLKYRAERLLRERGAGAIQEWIAKLERRKLAAARKRRLLGILRRTLRGC